MPRIAPTNTIEPPGGMTLQEAFEAYLDNEQLGCWRRATEAFDDHPGTDIAGNGHPPGLDDLDVEDSLRAPLSALRQDLMQGVLVAWGTEGKAAGVRVPVSPGAWSHIAIDGILASQLQKQEKPPIRQIRAYKASEIAEWRQGVQLPRAAELIDPPTYRTFNSNDVPVFIPGNFESMAQSSRFEKAQQLLRQQFFSLIDNGVLELRSLYPPGAPNAAWIPLSLDVLQTIDRGATRFSDRQKSQVQLMDETCYPVSVFLAEAPSHVQSAASSPREQLRAVSKKEEPVYTRIACAFDAQPNEGRADLETKAGRQRIRALIQAELPDINTDTLAREFRRFLADLRGGTQAGK